MSIQAMMERMFPSLRCWRRLIQRKPCKRSRRPPPMFNSYDQQRIRSAERKRERRQERNMRNEALQGREPDGLELKTDGTWHAQCRSCGRDYEIYCDAREHTHEGNFCGRRESCLP